MGRASCYTYLGIDFACNGAWDVHLKRVLDNGRKKVNQLALSETGILII